jgi:hypothetical protein
MRTFPRDIAEVNSDFLVKIIHVNDTAKIQTLSDNTKSVRSATWDPTGKYLVRQLLAYSGVSHLG